MDITIKPELMYSQNKAGLRQIYIRITQNRKHIRKKLNIAITGNVWANKHGAWIDKKHPEYKFLNNTIQTALTKYEKEFLNLQEKGMEIDKKDVFFAVNKTDLKQDFIKYYDEQMGKMLNWNQWRAYDVTRTKILAYQGTDKFDFKIINKDWLESFESWLTDVPDGDKLAPATIHCQFKRIRRMFNSAISEKLIDKGIYPFGKNDFRMPEIKVRIKKIERLDKDELKALFKLEYSNDQLKYYVHAGFLIAFNFAGIRIEDLLTLKWSNVKNGFITYNMKKGITNGKQKRFALNDKAKQIFEGLKKPDSKPYDYILPFLEVGIEQKTSREYKEEISRKTSLYNKYLKLIAKDLGTTKNLTSHLARHSWAAYTYEETKDVKLIQENLDHEDMKTTLGYIGALTTKENDQKLNNLYKGLY